MRRVKLASYGTCTYCRRVMAVTSAGVVRPHVHEHRVGPHAVAKDDCPGGGQAWAEYDADVAAVAAAQLPPAPVNEPGRVIDVDAVGTS